MRPVMTTDALHAFMDREFPQMAGRFVILHLAACRLSLQMRVGETDLRPGGTIAGPSIFALADCGFYLATLAMIGPKAHAVTTGCAIDFMRKPAPGPLRGDVRILKLGRSLSVGDVMIFSQGADEPVAHANLTYSLPPRG